MKNKRIVDAWSRVEPDAQAKERMYEGIMGKLEHKRAMGAYKPRRKKAVPAAACMLVLLAAAVITVPSLTSRQEDEPSTAPEIDVAQLNALIYVPLEQGGLKEVKVKVKGSPDALLAALSAHEVLPEGIKFNSFNFHNNGIETNHGDSVSYAVGDTNTVKADLPRSLIEYLNGLSLQQEQLVVEALVKTFAAYYQLDFIEITIDGQDFITGRASYAGQIKCGPED